MQPTPPPRDLGPNSPDLLSHTAIDPRPMAMDFAQETPTEVQLTIETFEDYVAASSSWSARAADDHAFFEGEHWAQKDAEALIQRSQEPAVIPVIYQVVEQAVSMLTSNRPSFRVTARSNDDAKRSHVRNQLLQWIWDQSSQKGFKFKTSVRDYYVRGRGVLHVYIDPDADLGKGEIVIEDLDPQYVYVSSTSKKPNWDDADHIILQDFMTRTQIARKWPHIDPSRIQHYPHGGSAQRIQRYGNQTELPHIQYTAHRPDELFEVLTRYTKVKRTFYRIREFGNAHAEELHSQQDYEARIQMTAYVLITQGQQPKPIWKVDAVGEMTKLFEMFASQPGQRTVDFHYRQPPMDPQTGQPVGEPYPSPGPPVTPDAIPGSYSMLYLTSVEELITSSDLMDSVDFQHDQVRCTASVGQVELYPGYDLPTSHFPVVPFLNNHNRTPFTSGDVRRIKNLQEILNKVWSLILAHTSNTTNQKVMFPEQALSDVDKMLEELSTAGTAMIPYNPSPMLGELGGIKIIAPSPLNQGLFILLDKVLLHMQMIVGIFPEQDGTATDDSNTYRGAMLKDEQSTRRINSKKQDIYDALGRVGKVALDLAADVYDEDKVIRLLNSSGDTEEFRLDNYELEARGLEDHLTNRYDVIVLGQSTLPSNRWGWFQAYLELFQLGIADEEAVLKHAEIPDAEQILERKSTVRQMMQAFQEVQGQLEKMTGDMQTLERELSHANRQVETAKFKAQLHGALATITAQITSYTDKLAMNAMFSKQLLAEQRKTLLAKLKSGTKT